MPVDIEAANCGIELEKIGDGDPTLVQRIEAVLHADIVSGSICKTGNRIAGQQIGVGVEEIASRPGRVGFGIVGLVCAKLVSPQPDA